MKPTLRELERETARTHLRTKKLKALIAAQNELAELEARFGSGGPAKTIPEITRIVSAHFRIPVATLTSAKRDAHIALARQVVYYLARTIGGYKFAFIGAALDLHHGTILSGVRAITNRRDTDPQFAVELLQLVKACTVTSPVAADRPARLGLTRLNTTV